MALGLITFTVAGALSVVVVGAGVSGLVSALKLSEANSSVTVLEEHDEIGVPCHCCGVVSTDYREKIGVSPPSSVDLNELRGFRFTDGAREIVVRSGRPVAKVISRTAFDRYLAETCERQGVTILRSRRGVSVENPESPRVLDSSGRVHAARYAVLAEGIAGGLERQLGMREDKAKALVSVQSLVRKSVDPSVASVYLNPQVSPDFFGYVVPIDEEHCRIGLASGEVDVMESLHFMVEKEGAVPLGKPNLWGMWVGGPSPNVRRGNVFAVGDAAGMTKATTGGGIVFGALSAKAVSEIIASEIAGGTTTIGDPLAGLRGQLGKMRAIRRLLNSIGPQLTMDAMLRCTTVEKLTRYMESVDFDFHGDYSRAIRAIELNLDMIPIGARVLYHLMGGLFK